MRKLFFIILLLSSFYEVKACQCEYDSLRKRDVYTVVDVPPEYSGGEIELMKCIVKHFHYPDQDIFQASFRVEFIVDERGVVSGAGIKGKDMRELTPAKKALLKVVSKMPGWKAGKCNGKTVPVKVTMPLYL